MLDKYLVCPCFGEEPFLVNSIDIAAQFVVTEEYYAVELSSGRFVTEAGELGDILETKLEEQT